jgi:hypothetical protein
MIASDIIIHRCRRLVAHQTRAVSSRSRPCNCPPTLCPFPYTSVWQTPNMIKSMQPGSVFDRFADKRTQRNVPELSFSGRIICGGSRSRPEAEACETRLPSFHCRTALWRHIKLAPSRSGRVRRGCGYSHVDLHSTTLAELCTEWTDVACEVSLDLPYDAAHHDGGFSLPAAKCAGSLA